jgi:hypothetical protein
VLEIIGKRVLAKAIANSGKAIEAQELRHGAAYGVGSLKLRLRSPLSRTSAFMQVFQRAPGRPTR